MEFHWTVQTLTDEGQASIEEKIRNDLGAAVECEPGEGWVVRLEENAIEQNLDGIALDETGTARIRFEMSLAGLHQVDYREL